MTAADPSSQPTLSIVIPTLNEAQYLRKTLLHTIANSGGAAHLQFIVVDGGSTDTTIASIKDLKAQTIIDPGLRGKKYGSLNRGLTHCQGSVVLFLDADTLVPQGFDNHIMRALHDSKVVGGAFEMAFSEMDARLRLLLKLNKIRYRIERIYYGDQALFCRVDVAREVGGFPKKPLMEAAYFCRLLRRRGRLRLLKPQVVTSSRRFTEGGVWNVAKFDLKMWWRFTLGKDISRYGGPYWKHNEEY